MAPGVETEVQFHHAGFEAARSAADISAEKSAQEAIHKAVEEGIKNAMVSGDRKDLYKALRFIEEQGHGLNNVENRYFAAYELAQGINSNWAKEDIKNRIDSTYGEGWTGKIKAMMAGVSEQTLAGKDAWYKNEWARRTAKVLGKTAISAGIGYSIAGAVAVMGGPVTWGAVGVAALGSAVGRGAVEAYRVIAGKERGMREKVNTDYLKRYEDVGKAAERVLKLETNMRNAATDDEKKQYQDAINQEYANLITMTNTDTLAVQEQELRKTEIKAEKMANWGAAAGAVVGSAAHVLKGAYDVTHGGRMFDFDANGVAHNVRQVTEAGHQLHGKFVYFLNPNEIATHAADPAHHWVTGGEAGHLLTENWNAILSALGKEALSGGVVVLPEAAQAIASSKGEAAAVQEMEARRQRVTTGPGAEMTKVKEKIEKGTPEPPTPETPPDPNIQPGIRYLFEGSRTKIIKIESRKTTAPAPGGPTTVDIDTTELWEIIGVLPGGYIEIQGPSGTYEIKQQELQKGAKWEHSNYSYEQWHKKERYKPFVEHLKTKEQSGEVIAWRKGAKVALGLDVRKDYEVVKIDEENNQVILADRSTGDEQPPIALSEVVNRVIREAKPADAETTEESDAKELEKLEKRFVYKFNKSPDEIRGINLVSVIRYKDADGITHVLSPGNYTVKEWDADKKEFAVIPEGKRPVRLGAKELLSKAQEIDSLLNDAMAARAAHERMPLRSDGTYRIEPGDIWNDGTNDYLVLPTRAPRGAPRAPGEAPPHEVWIQQYDRAGGRVSGRPDRQKKQELASRWTYSP